VDRFCPEQAPQIKALPSFEMGSYEEGMELKWKFKNMKIISVEDNIKAGYGVMPCPNLYDYPIRSLHYNRFGIAWGNEAGDVIGVVVCDVKARDGSAIVLVKVFVGPSLIEERTGEALEVND